MLRILCALSTVYLLLSFMPVRAQNPTPAACGLPKQGTITSTQDITYTLSANCTQTGKLTLQASGTAYTVTIAGKGFQIDGSSISPRDSLIAADPTVALEIKNATLVGGGKAGNGALHLGFHGTLTNVTMRQSYRTAVLGSSGSSGTYTLTSVLIENGRGTYNQWRDSPSAIVARGGGVFTIENLVVRDMILGNSAVGIEHWATSPTAMTIKGCFTAERIYPQVLYGSVTNNSTGPCTGTIGNGDQAVNVVPAPAPAACGLPASGLIEKPFTDKSSGKMKVVYNLSGDCQLTGALYFSQSSEVSINGNGRTITAKDNSSLLFSAGTTTIRNAIITGVSHPYASLYSHLREPLVIENTVFRDNGGPIYLFDSTTTLDNVLFRGNSTSYASTFDWANSAIRHWGDSDTTIRNSTFEDNSGGVAAIYAGRSNGKTKLEGCVTFSNNSPKDIHDPSSVLTNSTGGAVCPAYALPAIVDISRRSAEREQRRPPSAATRLPPGHHAPVNVGSLARIFRRSDGAVPYLQVYGISEQSTGYHILTVTQTEVDAVGDGLVAITADCHARVTVAANGDVTVSSGLNGDGSLLHTVLEGSVVGPVISTYTTYGDTLCPDTGALQSASQSTALADCMVRTTAVLNFRETPGGNISQILPSNVTLTALERTSDWFKVDFHGAQGWISADYVIPIGDCA